MSAEGTVVYDTQERPVRHRLHVDGPAVLQVVGVDLVAAVAELAGRALIGAVTVFASAASASFRVGSALREQADGRSPRLPLPYLIVTAHEDWVEAKEAEARARSMAAHPAGKGLSSGEPA